MNCELPNCLASSGRRSFARVTSDSTLSSVVCEVSVNSRTTDNYKKWSSVMDLSAPFAEGTMTITSVTIWKDELTFNCEGTAGKYVQGSRQGDYEQVTTRVKVI